MLLGQRNVQPVIGSRGLQLKIKATAKALAQRQSPRLVDPAAKGCVQYQLHTAAFIEKAFRDNCVQRRHRAQHGAARRDVANQLLRTGIIHTAFLLQPRHRLCHLYV